MINTHEILNTSKLLCDISKLYSLPKLDVGNLEGEIGDDVKAVIDPISKT